MIQGQKEQEIIEILFSGGCGGIAYQMGFSQFLIEILGKEKIKQCIIGGLSSGAAVAAYVYACVRSDQTMNYYYQNIVRKFYEPENKKYFGFFTNGQLMYDEAKIFYEECIQNGVDFNQGKYHFYYSYYENYKLKGQIIEKFDHSDDFAQAIVSSGFIPGIVGFRAYNQYKGKITYDGGFTTPIPYKYEHSKKVFLNILPSNWPFLGKLPKNCHLIDIYAPQKLQFPKDYWIWSEDWADDQFLKGYMAGQSLKQSILQLF